MAFREIDRPPSDKIIEPSEETGLTFVAIPSLKLFINEIAFWRQRRREADQAGDAVTRRIADESVRGLQRAAAGRLAIEEMRASNAYDEEVGGGWFVSSTLVVAHTRLMREIDQLPNGPRRVFGFRPNVKMTIDFSDRDLHRSGLHVATDSMRGILGVDPPSRDQERYYEGDAIYLRATTPATPAEGFMAGFQNFYGVAFDPSGYTSVVPRLKTEFWQSA